MKTLSLLVLLCSAAAALAGITCEDERQEAAAKAAVQHINEHHEHGYKFKFSEITSTRIEQVKEGCKVLMELILNETKCHVVNPTPVEDCMIRDGPASLSVGAICNITVYVTGTKALAFKYDCDTRREKTPEEMIMICPDCPNLLNLTDPEGLKSVAEAVKKFNMNESHQHYYILQEVGRIQSGYMPSVGMFYASEFVLVESHCPMGSRIMPQACKPLCPDRAHHAFCKSHYDNFGNVTDLECDFYPPKNDSVLDKEPVCPPPHAGERGPPPHAGERGPPPHAGERGPPPHAGERGPPPHAGEKGPPPHAGGRGPPPHAGERGPPPHAGKRGPSSHAHGGGPPPHAHGGGPPPHAHGGGPPPGHSGHFPCHGALKDYDHALHPICPWPRSDHNPEPRDS